MATLYNTEVKNGQALNGAYTFVINVTGTSAVNVTQVSYLSATNGSARILFNTASPLTTSALITATYANTAGAGVSSGAGIIAFNTAYNNTPAFIILQDRTSFAITLATGAQTLTVNGNRAWGPTERRLRHLEII